MKFPFSGISNFHKRFLATLVESLSSTGNWAAEVPLIIILGDPITTTPLLMILVGLSTLTTGPRALIDWHYFKTSSRSRRRRRSSSYDDFIIMRGRRVAPLSVTERNGGSKRLIYGSVNRQILLLGPIN